MSGERYPFDAFVAFVQRGRTEPVTNSDLARWTAHPRRSILRWQASNEVPEATADSLAVKVGVTPDAIWENWFEVGETVRCPVHERRLRKERIRGRKKRRSATFRAQAAARRKARYWSHRDEEVARQKEYDRVNRDRILARRKAHYKANREAVLARRRADYWAARGQDPPSAATG